MAPSETQFLEVASPEPHLLAYRCWGSPQSRMTVVCAHGLSRNGRDFDFLAEALAARGYRVIAADMPGRGESSNLKAIENYNNLHYVQDVKALLTHLGVQKVHWVGTSMGGVMAMIMEATYPGTLQSLVLNDIGCVLPAAGLAPIANYLGSPRPTEKEALKKWLVNNWTEFDVPGKPDEKYWQHLFTHYIKPDGNGGWKLPYDPNIVEAFGKAVAQAGGDADFSSVCRSLANVPTLLIRGAKSTLLTPEIASQTRALWNPDTPFEEVVVPNAGHAPMLMSDAEIQKVTGWVDRFQKYQGKARER